MHKYHNVYNVGGVMVITRNEALEKGYKTYNDGKQCKNCGGIERYVTSFACVACTSRTTKNRDPLVFKKYIKSTKGMAWLKDYRKTKVYRGVQNKHRREEYKKYPDLYKARQLKKYGLTLEDYHRMLEEQKYCCKICKATKDKLVKGLVVDHCHKTGRVRGLLCGKCNTAIGLLDENISLFDIIKEYLL